jgi:hypothetical protein
MMGKAMIKKIKENPRNNGKFLQSGQTEAPLAE